MDEEQQVERLKEFWKEHGKGIVAGVVIGFGLFTAGATTTSTRWKLRSVRQQTMSN